MSKWHRAYWNKLGKGRIIWETKQMMLVYYNSMYKINTHESTVIYVNFWINI